MDRIALGAGDALQHHEGYSPHLPVFFDNLPFFRNRSSAVRINYGVFLSDFPVIAKNDLFPLAHRAPGSRVITTLWIGTAKGLTLHQTAIHHCRLHYIQPTKNDGSETGDRVLVPGQEKASAGTRNRTSYKRW